MSHRWPLSRVRARARAAKAMPPRPPWSNEAELRVYISIAVRFLTWEISMASQAMHGASTFAAFGNVATCQFGARFGGEFRGFGKQGFWVTASSSARNQAPLPLPPDGRASRAKNAQAAGLTKPTDISAEAFHRVVVKGYHF